MPEQWLSVAETAALMAIHPRTVERRAAAGKLESRRNDDGQVQILVAVPDGPEPDTPVREPAGAFEAVREMADRQVDLAAGTASALIRAAQDQAMRAENQLSIARLDAGRYRREAQMAMGLLALMLLGVIVAVGVCVHTITAAHDAAAVLQGRAERAQSTVDEQQVALVKAVAGQAQAQGELTAYKAGLAAVMNPDRAKRPDPHPSFFQRLAQSFVGD